MSDLLRAARQIPELYADGAHHFWQDFDAVNNNAGPLLLEGRLRFTKKFNIDPGSADHYVVSIPTQKLYAQNIHSFVESLGITRDRIKPRSTHIGHVGGAATLVHLDHEIRSGELQPRQLMIVHAMESSK